MSRGEAETKQLETRLHNQERFSLLHKIFPNDEGHFYFTEALSYKFATYFYILSLLPSTHYALFLENYGSYVPLKIILILYKTKQPFFHVC
jgi:hypothetical protein